MAEMMDLYNEAENSVLGTDRGRRGKCPLVFTRVRSRISSLASRGRFSKPAGRCGRGDVIDPLTVKAACGSEFAVWLGAGADHAVGTVLRRVCGQAARAVRRYRLQSCSARRWTATLPGCRWKNSSARSCMNNVIADDNDQRSSTSRSADRLYGRMGTERQYLDWGFDELNRYVKVNPNSVSWLALDRVQANRICLAGGTTHGREAQRHVFSLGDRQRDG
ncbi:MAG: hypothetical protein ACLSF2_07425 [Butyricicoccus sp.]